MESEFSKLANIQLIVESCLGAGAKYITKVRHSTEISIEVNTLADTNGVNNVLCLD